MTSNFNLFRTRLRFFSFFTSRERRQYIYFALPVNFAQISRGLSDLHAFTYSRTLCSMLFHSVVAVYKFFRETAENWRCVRQLTRVERFYARFHRQGIPPTLLKRCMLYVKKKCPLLYTPYLLQQFRIARPTQRASAKLWRGEGEKHCRQLRKSKICAATIADFIFHRLRIAQ